MACAWPRLLTAALATMVLCTDLAEAYDCCDREQCCGGICGWGSVCYGVCTTCQNPVDAAVERMDSSSDPVAAAQGGRKMLAPTEAAEAGAIAPCVATVFTATRSCRNNGDCAGPSGCGCKWTANKRGFKCRF